MRATATDLAWSTPTEGGACSRRAFVPAANSRRIRRVLDGLPRRRYDVTLQPIDPGADCPPEDLEQGPYVAETYPVTVERRYVVVEVPG